MKELRPLGSEKLTGDDKLKRILELTYYGENQKKTSTDKPEYVTESKNGTVYGIVREKDGFYVKKGLNESSLEYIGGLFMKNKNKFSSYGEALKRLNLINGQDILQEGTRYVLKQNTPPPMESAPAQPPMDTPPPPDSSVPPLPNGDSEGDVPPPDEFGGDPSMGGEPSMDGEEGGGEDQNLRSSYMEQIQKFSGKLGQELRDQQERMKSDDIKYVLNMVISAIDIEKLDDEDLEEIAGKFDRDEDEFDDNGPGGEESGDEFEEPAPAPEEDSELEEDDYMSAIKANQSFEDDIDEYDDPMGKLEEFINSPGDGEGEESLFSKYSDLGNDSPKHSYLDTRSAENADPEYNDGYEDEDIDNLERDEEMNEYFDEGSDESDEFDNQMSSIHRIMNSDNPVKSPDVEGKPRIKFRTKPVEKTGHGIDIDEITNAVNSAIRNSLSKYN